MPLRLDIQLNSIAQAISATGAPTAGSYSIINPVLQMGLIVISDVAGAQISSMTGGNYVWSSVIYRMFSSTSPQGQYQNSVLVPARFSSLRWIVGVQREAANQELVTAYSVADHIRNKLVSYQFRVGSSYATQRPVDCTGSAVDAYMALRALGGDAVSGEHMSTLISRQDWTQDASAVVGTSQPGSFKISQSLQPFASQAALLSGIDSTASPIFCDLVYDPTAASTDIKSVRLDFLVAADSICSISNGELNVNF